MKQPKNDIRKHKAWQIQPNSVTNAKYSYTAIQENVVTVIIGAIQKHLTQEKPIQTDLFGQPQITLKSSDIGEGKNKYHVREQLIDLRKKDIEFAYTDPEDQKTRDVNTGLISSIRDIRQTDYIEVGLSVWAIPYLLYWGKGIGGTIYRQAMAINIKGIYAKRLYKLCCRWQDQGGFSMYLDELKKIFDIEKKYKASADIKRRVLEPAKKELQKKADLYFEYELNKIKSRSYNHISFKIFSQAAKKPQDNTKYIYQFVYNFICRTYPAYNSDKAMKITEKLAEDSSNLRKAYNKFIRLDDQYAKGEKNKEDVIKLTKYILKNDFSLT